MKTRLTNYVKSGYSCLYIVSHEESRVEASLREVVASLNANEELFNLCVWSVTEGIVQITKGGKPIAETQDPVAMLSNFMEAEEHTIFLCRDFHLFVEKPNPMLWRKMRDALAQAKSHMKTLVVLGCRLCIPPELEKEITVLDFALPDRAQLKVILDSLLESNGRAHPEDEAGILNAAAGLTTIEAENAFALSLIETGKVTRDVVYREKVAAVKKGGLLQVMESKLKLEDVGGLANLKAWLVEKKDQFLDCAAEYGLPPPRGIMLVGQPGCLHPNTPIYDPTDQTTQTVAERYAAGKPFQVVSHTPNGLDIAAALPPIKYPTAQMRRITFSNGQQITVTLGHRLLTTEGYRTVADCQRTFLSNTPVQCPAFDAVSLLS